jgi:type IV pilus assembly protein PilA
MFCVRCGAANAEGSQFCVKCGATIGAQGGAPANATSGPPPTAPPAGAVPPVGSASAPGAGGTPSHVPTQPIGPVESSGKALASMICGFLFFFFPVALVAIVLGHLALGEINRSAGRIAGRGMAIAGLVLGYSGVLFIPFVLIIAAIAIPNLLRARMAADEAVAVNGLRDIARADIEYESTYANGFAPSLEALGGSAGDEKRDCDHALLIDPTVAQGIKNGYAFSYAPNPPANHRPPVLSNEARANGCTIPGSVEGFSATADPVQRGVTGTRSFYVDQTGAIRFDKDNAASATSEPLD